MADGLQEMYALSYYNISLLQPSYDTYYQIMMSVQQPAICVSGYYEGNKVNLLCLS